MQDRVKQITNLEMIRGRGDKFFANKQMRCSKCNNTGLTMVKYLPKDFFVRLTDEAIKGVFTQNVVPRFDRAYPQALIQYRDQHFRTLKFVGRNVTVVLDGEEMTKVNGEEERKMLIDEIGWTNYIVHFKNFREDIYQGETNIEMIGVGSIER